MIAWLAYGNATSVRTLPPSAVKQVAAPPVDNGIPGPVPSLSIPAPQAAAIVDAPEAEPDQRPAMVMLPPEQHGGVKKPAAETRTAATVLPVEQPAFRPARARETGRRPGRAGATTSGQIGQTDTDPAGCAGRAGQKIEDPARRPQCRRVRTRQRRRADQRDRGPLDPPRRRARQAGELPGQEVPAKHVNAAVNTPQKPRSASDNTEFPVPWGAQAIYCMHAQ